MIKIGVFDSGIGGKAVANRLETLFPEAKILFVSDREHMPYGSKSEDDIRKLTEQAVKPLVDEACDAIVIACNTATTVAITSLRNTYPQIHFVGIEPMVKPAARLTKTKSIAVLATPRTLGSKRYSQLKKDWASGITVIEPNCESWAPLIETGRINEINLEKTISPLIAADVDVIVLGCTHYHWLKERIEKLSDQKAQVIEPSDAIGARLDYLLTTATELHG